MAIVKDLPRVAPELASLAAVDYKSGTLAATSNGSRYISSISEWINLRSGSRTGTIIDARILDHGEGIAVTQQ